MYCDNCEKEITRSEAYNINDSRQYWLLADNGGSIHKNDKGTGYNYVCWECQCKAIELIHKENKGA